MITTKSARDGTKESESVPESMKSTSSRSCHQYVALRYSA